MVIDKHQFVAQVAGVLQDYLVDLCIVQILGTKKIPPPPAAPTSLQQVVDMRLIDVEINSVQLARLESGLTHTEL